MIPVMSAVSKVVERQKVADPWMSIKEAASQLDISRHMLLKRAASGEFETTLVADRLVVSRASVERAVGQEA